VKKGYFFGSLSVLEIDLTFQFPFKNKFSKMNILFKSAHILSLCVLSAFTLQPNRAEAQLLWEITGKGMEKPSYLFGTMHVNDQRVFNYADSVLEKVYACEVMAGELKLNDPAQMQAIALKMMMRMNMPSDTSYKDLLSKKDYKFLVKEMKSIFGTQYENVLKSRPFMIQTQMAAKMGKAENKTIDEPATKETRPALDIWLQNQATEKGLEVIGLETVEEQLFAFFGAPLEKQAASLVETLKAYKDNKGEAQEDPTAKLMELYVAQDIEAMYALTSENMKDELGKIFLDDRNERMVERMIKVMENDQKAIFSAVGAAHLGGQMGMLKLLENQGYTVKALR